MIESQSTSQQIRSAGMKIAIVRALGLMRALGFDEGAARRAPTNAINGRGTACRAHNANDVLVAFIP
jgi:hypothetical protein